MKKTVVFGTGDFSDVVSYVMEKKLNMEIVAYTINEKYINSETYNGKPLVPFEKLELTYLPDDYDVVLGFIGKRMFEQRADLFEQIKRKGYSVANIIDPSACVDTEDLGEGNIILGNTSVEAHCSIGDGNIIWQNVVMPHHNKVGSFNNLAPSVSMSGYSKVGSHCFVGNNVCIKNRVMINDYAYIGAGSYISKDVSSNTVMVPNRSYALPEKTGFDFL